MVVCKERIMGSEMKEDQFQLLISRDSNAVYDEFLQREIHPVESVECTKNDYQRAATIVKLVAKSDQRNIIHGRRINDEVELFEYEDGEETPGLRYGLERKGLVVRERRLQPARQLTIRVNRPATKARPVSDSEPKMLLDKCTDTIRHSIRSLEVDERTTIDYGILADSGKPNKSIIVIKMRRDDYLGFYRDSSEQVFQVHEDDYRVLGAIEQGVPRFKYRDDKITSFFKHGGKHVDVCFFNDEDFQLRQEEEEKRLAKKQAKKHRRRATASTLLSTNDTPYGTPPSENEETVRARRREKNRLKKKAQKDRKKAKEAEEDSEEVDESFTTPRSMPEEDKKTECNDNGHNGISSMHLCGPFWAVKANGKYKLYEHREGINIVAILRDAFSNGTVEEEKPELKESESESEEIEERIFGTGDSSSNDDGSESDEFGLKIGQATMAIYEKGTIAESKGMAITTQRAEIGLGMDETGLQHLGRGL